MFFNFGNYPNIRQRRLRQASWIRNLVSESQLQIQDLILPIFVRDNNHSAYAETLNSFGNNNVLQGMRRYLISELDDVLEKVNDLGILAIALFPVTPSHLKTGNAVEALNPDNLICQAIRKVKNYLPQLGVITDIALDPYTDHGHDGIFCNGDVDNDLTVNLLSQQAINQAKAGCDIVAPSDMMDGRIQAIRGALDDEGFEKVIILSYAAKYASNFYGPFRQTLDSNFTGSKATYQLDFANSKEALRKIAMDLSEGADMLIIKPGTPYLDIIYQAQQQFNVPIFAYQVSGEYAMLKITALSGMLNYEQSIFETCMGFKRAGANAIITYGALELAEHLACL